MNWNNYDTKYIIKRLIIGFGMLILFSLLTTLKANALTTSSYMGSWQYNYVTSNQNHGEISIPMINENNQYYQAFNNSGEGNVIFTLVVANASGGTDQLRSVYVTNSTNTNSFACEMGTISSYNDNLQQRILYTLNCPVNFTNGNGMAYIYVQQFGSAGQLVISTSKVATFVSKDNVSVNVNQQQVVNAITNSQQATINSINNASNQAHQDAQQAHQDAQDIKDTITNDNVDGAKGDMDNFNNNSAFSDSTGLQAVIELPLNLVNSFTNTCQPISITIPWLDYTGTIPCMSTIYRSHFNNLYNVVKLIINGFFVYRILLKIYELVHEAKQPDEDKLEVIEL